MASGKQAKGKARATVLGDAEDLLMRGDAVFEETDKFCKAVGLHKGLMLEIYRTDSDWAFVLKIDALLETALREIIKSGLKLKILDRVVGEEALAEFVDGLPMNGKTSLLGLLNASGCPPEDSGFIEAVRHIRNAYAQNIKFADLTIMRLIEPLTDKSTIIKNIWNAATYREPGVIALFEKDKRFLRFSMLDGALRILFYAYNIPLKKPSAHRHKSKLAA